MRVLSSMSVLGVILFFAIMASCSSSKYERERIEHEIDKHELEVVKDQNERLRYALMLAVDQRKFWHQEYLNCEGTPNDGGEQQAEDDYQIEQELRVDNE